MDDDGFDGPLRADPVDASSFEQPDASDEEPSGQGWVKWGVQGLLGSAVSEYFRNIYIYRYNIYICIIYIYV